MPKVNKKLAALSQARKAREKKRTADEVEARERLQWQERQDQHKSSMTFMATNKVQNLINHFPCPKCNQRGSQLVNQRSLKGVITNLEIICRCGSKFTSWTAEDTFTDATLVSAKMNGITRTQLERFLLCLNFTAETDAGSSISLSSVTMKKKIQEINSKLIVLKEKIEKTELDRILAERPDTFIASEDGAYPNGVRTRNSGACFNTVIAYDQNNKAKVVCK